MSEAEVGPLDDSLASHVRGEWRLSERGELSCVMCGKRLAHADREGARLHWEGHAKAPSVRNGFRMVWYVHPAGGPGRHVARGGVGAFLAAVMAPAYLRSDLPVPRVGVVQELVDQGERLEGMGAGFDWSRFEVTNEIYRAAMADLVAAGLARPGSDPTWVDSLFFRRAERLAVERGTDVQHEIRRMTVMHESAAIRARFPDLDEAVVSALRRRSAQADNYDFDQSLDTFGDPPSAWAERPC